MSFESKMKKRGNKNLNKFAKNPYHTPWYNRIPLWVKVTVPSFAVVTAAILVVTLGVIPAYSHQTILKGTGSQEDASIPRGSYYPGSLASGESQTAYIPRWEEKTLIQKYPNFTYDGISYSIRYTDDKSGPIDNKYAGDKIQDITVTGHDIYEEKDYEIEAEIYSIKNIANVVSLAIKFQDSEYFYAYQNIFYDFPTIGDLLSDISFASEVKIPTAYYRGVDEYENAINLQYNDVTTEEVVALLFDDPSIPNILKKNKLYLDSSSSYYSVSSSETTNLEKNGKHITFMIQIDALGIDNAGMQIYTNGDLDVNLFNHMATFHLGEEKYQAVIAYLHTKTPTSL